MSQSQYQGTPLHHVPNPDLVVGPDNKSSWTRADERRCGWHNLHRIARYTSSFRAPRLMLLEKRMSLAIPQLASVRLLTSLPWFSAMVVVRDQHVLFERYSPDFAPDRPHSIQSITKTLMNLLVGRLVEDGVLDLSRPVSHYVPEIGSGYAPASLQQVMNMDVVNDYTEDFTNRTATYYRHEEAMGWRLPQDPTNELTQWEFLRQIASIDTTNTSGVAQYKDANTDVMGWVCARASGRTLRRFIAEIADASGLEGSFYITTDRDGVPALDGGGCMTARDLARYFSLFVRGGRGISGETVGSATFIERSLRSGIPMASPYQRCHYSNHLMVSGSSVGHGGWGGQYALANLATRTVGVFFSVLENEHAINSDYLGPVIEMLEEVTGPAVA
jgi:CubicO group peptidase (beta-lactamase class C family)